MLNIWQLPQSTLIGGVKYDLHTDFRDILEIFSYFSREDIPPAVRWQIAIGLFYRQKVPRQYWPEAARYLSDFINCGQQGHPGPKLLDWQQDAEMIVADVNHAAGQEIRQLPYVHWWTFLSWFHSIGQGQLSTVIAIRHKLQRGKKLEGWEQEFYRENKHRIVMKKPLTPSQQAQKEQLEKLLGAVTSAEGR